MTPADDFRDLASWAEGSDPLYAHLCRRAADDPELLALAEAVPDDRQAPHLLLAAVQYLLERTGDHPLARYYPGLTDDARPTRRATRPSASSVSTTPSRSARCSKRGERRPTPSGARPPSIQLFPT